MPPLTEAKLVTAGAATEATETTSVMAGALAAYGLIRHGKYEAAP